jgi:hypothetical protein
MIPKDYYLYYVKTDDGRFEERSDITVPLGVFVPTVTLYKLYCGWARSTGVRNIESPEAFGRHLTEVLGPHVRLSGGKRPWGYFIPEGAKLREGVMKAWGIKEQAGHTK